MQVCVPACRDEEQGFSFGDQQQDASTSGAALQPRAQPTAPPPAQQQQPPPEVAGTDAAAEIGASGQEDESNLDGRSSSSLQVYECARFASFLQVHLLHMCVCQLL